MTLVTLKEFREITGVRDSTLVRLLIERQIPCALRSDGVLCIDLAQLDLEQFATFLARESCDALRQLGGTAMEELAQLISDHFDSVVELAVQEVLAKSAREQ